MFFYGSGAMKSGGWRQQWRIFAGGQIQLYGGKKDFGPLTRKSCTRVFRKINLAVEDFPGHQPG
jgi:hypothetical protein